MELQPTPDPRPATVPRGARLPGPGDLRASLPIGPEIDREVSAARDAIRDALHGRDPERLVIVTGPCSIHDRESALEYAAALRRVARDTRDQLVVVMRTYFDKPRTTVGWKGLINDPFLDGSRDVRAGLALARSILRDTAELGVACGGELLDPLAVPYLEDLLAWGVIGARTVESQPHRELASGAAMPIGFKNDTAGSIERARDAMTAARVPHSHVGVDARGRPSVVHTRGNPDGHLVLRGGPRPNHDPASVRRALELTADQGPARPIMVDCSHGNSGKDHTRQTAVFRDVLEQVLDGQPGLLGLMLESHLRPGRQDLPAEGGGSLAFGVSITDACIGWDETEGLLYEAAAVVERLRARRRIAS